MPLPNSPRRTVSSPIPTLVEHVAGHPLVDFSFMFRGGSATDPVGREGRLALTTRTLLRGTKRHTADRFEQEIDRLGAEIETEVDADCVTVHATVLARNAERLFALVAEALTEPRFSPLEAARQRRAMIADIVDRRNDDDDLSARAFARTLFAGHPYGRPCFGTVDSLRKLTRDDLVAAHRDFLGTANLQIGAAGPIDEVMLDRLVATHLRGLHTGRAASPFPATPVNVRGRNLLLVDKPERTRHSVIIGGLGSDVRDRDHIPLYVANAVLGGMFTSRLSNELRVRRGWSYDVHSTLSRGSSRQSFAMVAMPSSADLGPTIALVTAMLERWIAHGVTPREVALAKRYLTNGYAFEIETAVKRLDLRLTAASWGLPADYFDEFTHRIAAVTPQQATDAIRARITADDVLYAVVASAPEHRAIVERSVPRLRASYVHPFGDDLPVGGLSAWHK